MGILNVTPDSFSDGGEYLETKPAVNRALNMEQQGADIVDIGGESTRPGAERVSLEEELSRTIPVIEGIRRESSVPISIDTYKLTVAARALDAGANIVNDISALRFDPNLAQLVANREVPVILMHMQGEPRTMQSNPVYEDVVEDIIEFLAERIAYAQGEGINRDNIIIDPGMGFGKTVDHNFEIMRRLEEFNTLGVSLLLGTSRKSFIGKTLDLPVENRLEGTIATNVIGLARGAKILRVHDVKEVKRAVEIAVRCL